MLYEVITYAVCDLNEERAKKAAEKYNVPHVYTDYRDLLANSEIDAVSICTWNNSHAEISIASLEAGKNVLCEKPLCKTVVITSYSIHYTKLYEASPSTIPNDRSVTIIPSRDSWSRG